MVVLHFNGTTSKMVHWGWGPRTAHFWATHDAQNEQCNGQDRCNDTNNGANCRRHQRRGSFVTRFCYGGLSHRFVDAVQRQISQMTATFGVERVDDSEVFAARLETTDGKTWFH